MPEKITSRNNPKIKNAAGLVSSAAARREQSRFVIEGLRLCTDAALSGIGIEETYVTSEAYEKYGEKLETLFAHSDKVFEIGDEVAARLSDTKSPQGVFSLCKMLDNRRFSDTIRVDGVYAAVENLQTPANLGAVCRTAEALGLDGLIVGGGCDIYNPKALRASMGSLFRLPVCETDSLPALLASLREKGMTALASVPDSSAVKITQLDKKSGVICVIGNEGSGISDETVAVCDCKVTIPMRGRAESLNAAAAASILMWEMVR